MVLPAKSSQHAADRPCREGETARLPVRVRHVEWNIWRWQHFFKAAQQAAEAGLFFFFFLF